jgi:hypothetical protein
MRLYRARIPTIAQKVISVLTADESLEVIPENKEEAAKDLEAIMEHFLTRDADLRRSVKDQMARHNIPYERFGRVRAQLADEWGHPLGDDVERWLARQFIEQFMMSNFVEEVWAEDKHLYKVIVDELRSFSVDEQALREEARGRIKNVKEGTVDYELALQRALKEVKKRHGLFGP